MQKIYLPLLLLLPLFVTAQKKVDLDRFHFTVQYRSLPQIKIDSTYRTYNVSVKGTKLMRSFLNEWSPEETVILEGWRKLENNGHITINVNLEDLLSENISVKERQEVTKDRLGQISTKTYYREEVRYSFAATANITDYKGAHIMDIDLAGREHKFTYSSPEFAFRPLAQGYFLLNTVKVTSDLFRRSVNNAMHNLSEQITDNFGFREVRSNDFMWVVDSRKHPEYEAHRHAFQQLSEVFFNMNANTPIENVREQVKPVISYFDGTKKEYSTNSKHDRKMRYASYFNLAVLYYYLDDPQLMMKEAQGLILNDYESRDGNGFESTARWLKNLFETTNKYSRHFNIDVTGFKGPFENDAVTVK